MIRQDTALPVNGTGLYVGNTCAVIIGVTYIGSTGVLVKETDFRCKTCLSTGIEDYLKKDNAKCAELIHRFTFL